MGANGLDTTVRDFAIDLARRAGDILIEIRERGLRQDSIHPKLGHFDIVTEADLASEQFILSELAAAFPSYGVMSEETNQRLSDKEWVWIVDPLDGTTNFASTAFRLRGQHRAGARRPAGASPSPTSRPTSRHTGPCPGKVRGCAGATASSPARVTIATFNTPCWRPAFSTHAMRGATTGTPNSRTSTISQSVRRLGSAAMTMAWIAAGHLEAYWETGLKAWDFAPGWLIVEEAGGQLVEFDGSPISLDSLRR